MTQTMNQSNETQSIYAATPTFLQVWRWKVTCWQKL